MSKKNVRMPWAASVVARSYPDRIIGIENQLPWHLGTDLKRFRRRTEGHAVIMGRKTFESIGRPLPKRLNIVLSREKVADSENLKWADSPETAILLADNYSIINLKKQFFVIGGERIYDLFNEFINKVFLTDVFCGNINGDAKFPYEFPKEHWRYISEEEFSKSDIDDHAFRITCLIKRKPTDRFKSREAVLRSDPQIAAFLDKYIDFIEAADYSAAEPKDTQMNLFE
nr:MULTISPECIES: dihydrofolate reductase [unclassified Ochrobactrum]